jgi:hypothetical protein
MIAEQLSEQVGVEIVRRQIDSQPLRNIGVHSVPVRLTVDLVPEITVIVYREGESPETVLAEVESATAETMVAAESEEAETFVESEAIILEAEPEIAMEVEEEVVAETVSELEANDESEMETPEA